LISLTLTAEAILGSALLGLAVGWFLDTLIVRWVNRVREREFVSRPAFAPGQESLSEHEPLSEQKLHSGREPASGRSRARTWLVVIVTAASFVLAYVQFDTIWELVFAWWFVTVMILLAFIDLAQMTIPNRIVLPSALIGLAGAIALDPEKWWVYVVASAGAALFLFLLALVWRGGMGAGDVKMALFMGAALGALVVVAMFFAFMLGAIVGVILIASKSKTRRDVIPFGPYLALGSVLALLYGPEVIDWYVSLLP
jgi:leader peptidase (prepilin peptidase)/N-methyltransferase